MIYKLKSEPDNIILFCCDTNNDLLEASKSVNIEDNDNSHYSFKYHRCEDNTRVFFTRGTLGSDEMSIEEWMEDFVYNTMCLVTTIQDKYKCISNLIQSYYNVHKELRPERFIQDQYKYFCKLNQINYTETGLEYFKKALS